MKKTLHVAILGSALILSACGGGSSDSSSFKGVRKLGNGNVYTCPSQKATDQCTSDTTCAKVCTLTKKVVSPVVPGKGATGNQCKVKNTTVYGIKGGTCKVSLPKINGGLPTEVSCQSNGALVLLGITARSGVSNLVGYRFTCK